ncbi:MAG: glycosyltransferase family 39 protein, partial [Candidatus Sulfotelmatobacter sp.]
AGVGFTLFRRAGFRMLRFVTLIPVVLAVAAVLKLGSVSVDQTLSSRPLARQIASVETYSLPLAVFGVRREVEYGLAFYRNQTIVRYERDGVPAEEHLLVTPENSRTELEKQVAGRRILLLGHFAPQNVDYYWVAAGPRPAQ